MNNIVETFLVMFIIYCKVSEEYDNIGKANLGHQFTFCMNNVDHSLDCMTDVIWLSP